MVRNARSLMFVTGELAVDGNIAVTASGVWKKLDT